MAVPMATSDEAAAPVDDTALIGKGAETDCPVSSTSPLDSTSVPVAVELANTLSPVLLILSVFADSLNELSSTTFLDRFSNGAVRTTSFTLFCKHSPTCCLASSSSSSRLHCKMQTMISRRSLGDLHNHPRICDPRLRGNNRKCPKTRED